MKLCMGCMESIEDSLTTCPHCGYNETTLRQESYYLDPGTIVGGKYIVGKVLGYSGYTVTYLGMDAELNRKIMVKEYLPSDFSTRSEGEKEVTIYSGDALEQFEQGLTTFLNEANRIQHLENIPGIAKVYNCVAENDTGYVISEYLEGHTLKEVLDSGRNFTPQEAKNIISQILEGLRLVHPLDVIHCDIAPETIMITNTGEIKLLDFGATRYVTTANSKSLAIILKQGYAPEEQYRSQGERGPWTDVYALAAVMYRMITGKTPDESVDRALMDELKEPSKLGIQIPKNMENALMNALNVYKKDRTPSAEVFLKELNSPEVKRIQVKKQKYETGKFPRWAKGLVAGLLCLVIIGGIAVYSLNDPVKQADTNELKMEKIIGKSEDEANKILKEALNWEPLNEEEQRYSYRENVPNGSIILTQNIAYGDWVDKSKSLICDIRTSEKFQYKDISSYIELDVDSLAQHLHIDTESKVVDAEGEDREDENKTYGDFYSIKLKDHDPMRRDELEKYKKIIHIKDIENIARYVSPYLSTDELGEYTGWYVNNVKFDKYKYDDKTKKMIKTGDKGSPNACDPIYISLDPINRKKGYIVEQLIPEGEKYDSKDRDKENKRKILFNTIGEVVDWNKKMTGTQLKSKLINEYDIGENNITIKGGESEGTIEKVRAGQHNGVKESGFVYKKENAGEITITITTKPRPVLTPAPTPQPTKRPTGNTQRNHSPSTASSKPSEPEDRVDY